MNAPLRIFALFDRDKPCDHPIGFRYTGRIQNTGVRLKNKMEKKGKDKMKVSDSKVFLDKHETEAFRLVIVEGKGGPGHRWLATKITNSLEAVIRCAPKRYTVGIPVHDYHGNFITLHQRNEGKS